VKVVRTIKVTGGNSLIEVKGSTLPKKKAALRLVRKLSFVPISFSLLSKLSPTVFSNSELRPLLRGFSTQLASKPQEKFL